VAERELERLVTQVEVLRRQIEAVRSAIAEIQVVEETLSNIKGVEEGKPVLIPVGASCYVRGMITDKDKVIMGVGAGILVEKTVDDALKVLEERRKRLEEEFVRLNANLREVILKIEEVRKRASTGRA